MSSDSEPTRATVVVMLSASVDSRPCFDALRGTLGANDQVLGIVESESIEAVRQQLAGYPWVDLIASESERGYAAERNRGAQVARGWFIVYLNRTAIVTDGWLDELLAPLEDVEVGAVGPRSNIGSDEQVIADPRFSTGEGSIAEFTAAWRKDHSGESSEVAHLVGPSLALRTEVLRDIGSYDERYVSTVWADDDVCMALRSKGRRLLVAHGSVVRDVLSEATRLQGPDHDLLFVDDRCHFKKKWHIDGVPPLRLLSVCLIVKDEEEMLGACLESVRQLADEVVIYDTGSTDRTIEIARAAGAKVIEGYWDNSFARARNAALSHALGDWVLSLDADETFFGDPLVLRRLLSNRGNEIEGYSLAIENVLGESGAHSTHTAIRLFRRSLVTWQHRLHEQPVARAELGRPLRLGHLVGSHLLHRGYIPEVFDARNKAQRNLDLALAAVEDATSSGSERNRAYALTNYGRSLVAAGRSAEAVSFLLEAITLSDEPFTQRVAMKNVVGALSDLERFDEALFQVDQFRHRFTNHVFADVAEGTIRVRMGDYETGLRVLDRVPQRCRDDDGMEYGVADTVAIRADALASLHRYAEASDLLLETIRDGGVLQVDLTKLVSWLERVGRSPSEIADVLDPDDSLFVLGRVLGLSSNVADLILERAAERLPERIEVLAVASRLGPQLSVERALVWSSRLRQRGLAGACPLVAIVRDQNRDPEVRILAGAAAYGMFGDCAVVAGVQEARSSLSPVQFDASTALIQRLAPGLLEVDSGDMPSPIRAIVAPPVRTNDRGRQSRLPTSSISVASDPKRGGVNVVGPFKSTSIDGEISRIVTTALRRGGVAVSTVAYDPDARRGPVPWESEGAMPYDTTLLVLPPESLSTFALDHGVGPFEGRYVIGVWRSEFDVPRESVGEAAALVHEVWAPSKFAVDALRRVTDRTIMEVPLPLAVSRPASDVRERAARFTFLTRVDYSLGFERQNPLGVVSAFRSAFRDGEGPHLVIGTTDAPHYIVEHRLLLDAVGDRNDIHVLSSLSSDAGMSFDLVDQSNSCYVSLHRSEGTGLALIRAMVGGVVTIATNHSVGAVVGDERGIFSVPCTLRVVPDGLCGVGGTWAEPDLASAASRMREVVDVPARARQRAMYAQSRGRRVFAEARSAGLMKKRIAEIDRNRYDVRSHRPARGHDDLASGRVDDTSQLLR